MYEYKIKKIIKMYDGDTITVDVELGFGVTYKTILRLSNINAPEVRGVERPQGLITRDWLRDRLNTAVENNEEIIIRTEKDKKGKYGRYIAEVFVEGISINEEMVKLDLAEHKQY